MQQSDDPRRKAAVLSTCYLDDSGTEPASRVVVIGGCLLGRTPFSRLDEQWKRMLHRHRISSLHMADFVRPFGQNVGMYQELKISLFTEAVTIINKFKDYSISASVLNSDYKECFESGPYRKALGPYTVAFTSVAHLNVKIAKDMAYPDRIAYLIDRGCPVSSQIDLGHKFMTLIEKASGETLTGSLTFESDENNTALQAADLIAWTSRRKLSGDGLKDEFLPLLGIFKERFNAGGIQIAPHIHHDVEGDSLTKIRGKAQDIEGNMDEIRELLQRVWKGANALPSKQ